MLPWGWKLEVGVKTEKRKTIKAFYNFNEYICFEVPFSSENKPPEPWEVCLLCVGKMFLICFVWFWAF